MRISALSLAISLLIAGSAWADQAVSGPAGGQKVTEICGSPNCCAHCGRHSCCNKVCTVVPTTKEVKKTVWVVKCEEYCRSLPGNPLCRECCSDCGGKGCSKCASSCGPCAVEQAKRQTPPSCGSVHCRKVLEKKEIVCSVPTYKCVVSYCCPSCTESAPAAAPTGSPTVAPTPAPAIKAIPAPTMKTLPPPPKTSDLAPLPQDLGVSQVP